MSVNKILSYDDELNKTGDDFSTEVPEDSRLQRRFNTYHQENPNVYKLFKQFAIQSKYNGRRHFGAKAIMERVRWEVSIETKDAEFKINNNYTSRYVRLLEKEDPSFIGFFQKRELRA